MEDYYSNLANKTFSPSFDKITVNGPVQGNPNSSNNNNSNNKIIQPKTSSATCPDSSRALFAHSQQFIIRAKDGRMNVFLRNSSHPDSTCQKDSGETLFVTLIPSFPQTKPENEGKREMVDMITVVDSRGESLAVLQGMNGPIKNPYNNNNSSMSPSDNIGTNPAGSLRFYGHIPLFHGQESKRRTTKAHHWKPMYHWATITEQTLGVFRRTGYRYSMVAPVLDTTAGFSKTLTPALTRGHQQTHHNHSHHHYPTQTYTFDILLNSQHRHNNPTKNPGSPQRNRWWIPSTILHPKGHSSENTPKGDGPTTCPSSQHHQEGTASGRSPEPSTKTTTEHTIRTSHGQVCARLQYELLPRRGGVDKTHTNTTGSSDVSSEQILTVEAGVHPLLMIIFLASAKNLEYLRFLYSD